MKGFIKGIPLPFAGMMLASAALGNLLQNYSEAARIFFGATAFVIFMLLILKFVFFPSAIKEDLKNPVLASVSGTFSMGLMLLSVYMRPLLGHVSIFIWYFAILLHISLIIYFTLTFVVKLDIKKVFTSYFIVYVGIVSASITALAHGQELIGQVAFWIGFASLIPLLILVGYRYVRYNHVPESAQPLYCIFAAPVSLCLVGYLQSFSHTSTGFIIVMLVLAIILYVLAFVRMVSYFRLKFYPSYAAFTFPFVISAIATKQATTYLGIDEIFQMFLIFQIVIALTLVVYTLVRYAIFLTRSVR